MSAQPLKAIEGGRMAVAFDDKGNLKLPPAPRHEDHHGLCQWLTVVFALNPAHPITKGVRQGLSGPEGHIELQRAGASPLRFEPASKINSPQRIHECLNWTALPTDEAVPAFMGSHCRQIAHVIRMLCGITHQLSAKDEAAGIVGTFLGAAQPIEGLTTYGTSPQRYEAANALQRDIDEISGRSTGPMRYLLDSDTGEYVIRVVDLATAARIYTGSSIPHGWLDARMSALGWKRIPLDGHRAPGREGRTGPHLRTDTYRGHVPTSDPETVTT